MQMQSTGFEPDYTAHYPHISFLMQRSHPLTLWGWKRAVLPMGITAPLWANWKTGQPLILLTESSGSSFFFLFLLLCYIKLHSEESGYHLLYSPNLDRLMITASLSMTALKDRFN